MTAARSGNVDLILCGRVVTLDRDGTIAEAIAIHGDRIVAVGTRDDVLNLRGADTGVVEVRGTIIPGFNDAHAHLDAEGLRGHFPSLGGVKSIADVLARIAMLAAQTPKGQWVITMPVGSPPYYYGGPKTLAEGRMPDRHELDRAAPDHPVCILPPSSYWGLIPCYAALNTAALALNGIDRNKSPRVQGIEIERDAAGEPTGVLVDRNYPDIMQSDLLPALPRFTAADRRAGILRAMKTYHAFGTTSIYEGHGCIPEIVDIYRDLRRTRELTMRTVLVASPLWRSMPEAEREMREALSHARGAGSGDNMLKVSGVFVNYRGDPAAASVSLSDPTNLGWSCYAKQANDPDVFEALCMLAAEHDLRIHTVVIDKLHEIVPILERVDARVGLSGRRWVLEHISATRLSDLERLQALGVGVTLIPEFHLSKGGMRFAAMPEADAELVAPLKQLAALGVPVSAGTDNSPPNPLATLRAAMTRRERTKRLEIGPRARVDVEVALRAMTTNGAWLTFEEHEKGALQAGNYADLAIFDKDLLSATGETIETFSCLATMVGGRFVHNQIDERFDKPLRF